MEQKRAAVYCRVSTGSDLQEGSFEIQRDAYLKMIGESGEMILAGVYGDQGKSGRSMDGRTAFQQMLHDCETGKIDVILTKSISRFARNMADCVDTVRRLKTMGIPVIFEREGINTLDERSELLLGILAAIAQEESRSISQNICWAHDRRNAAGDPFGRMPYGYRRDKVKRCWTIFEPEAERIRYAFDKAAEGCCYQEIRQGLNDMERRDGTGMAWSQARLGKTYANVCYKGDYLTNKTVAVDRQGRRWVRNEGIRDQYYLLDHHEAIVDREVFDHVQLLVERHLLFSNRKRYTCADHILLRRW